MNDSASRNDRRTLSVRIAPYLGLVAVLLLGALLRFYALDRMGLTDGDAIYFTYIAQAWSEGNFVDRIGYQAPVSRPVIFALYGAAIKIFGFHDHAIKTLNALLDTANILLVFLVTFLISRGRIWVALAPAIPYAFLPLAIYMSRLELTHISSTFLALLSLISFVLYYQALTPIRRCSYLAVAGLLAGLTALTHEELIFLAPGYLLFLVISHSHALWTARGRRRLTIDLLIFGSVPLLVAKWILTVAGDRAGRHVAYGVVQLDRGHVWAPVERFWRYGYDAISAGTSSFVLVLFVLSFVGILWIEVRNRRRAPDSGAPRSPGLVCLPLVLIVIYLAFNAWLFAAFYMRLFLPLLPLVLISIALWLSAVLATFIGRYSAVAVVVLCTITVPFNLSQYRDYRSSLPRGYMATWAPLDLSMPYIRDGLHAMSANYSTSGWRHLWDVLAHRVTANSRVLVTSSLIEPLPGRRTLQIGYYFGDNAVYVIDHDDPLDEIIRQKNIKYVVFTRWGWRRSFLNRTRYTRYLYAGRWEPAVPLTLGKAYDFAPDEYTVAREYEFLTSYLAARGARVIVIDGEQPAASFEPPPIDAFGYIVYEL